MRLGSRDQEAKRIFLEEKRIGQMRGKISRGI
jgi:hypothetical protein